VSPAIAFERRRARRACFAFRAQLTTPIVELDGGADRGRSERVESVSSPW